MYVQDVGYLAVAAVAGAQQSLDGLADLNGERGSSSWYLTVQITGGQVV